MRYTTASLPRGKILPASIIQSCVTSKQTCITGCTCALLSNLEIKKSGTNTYQLTISPIVFCCAEIVDVGRESNPSVTRRILIEEQRRTHDLGVEILRNDEAKYLGVI